MAAKILDINEKLAKCWYLLNYYCPKRILNQTALVKKYELVNLTYFQILKKKLKNMKTERQWDRDIKADKVRSREATTLIVCA